MEQNLMVRNEFKQKREPKLPFYFYAYSALVTGKIFVHSAAR